MVNRNWQSVEKLEEAIHRARFAHRNPAPYNNADAYDRSYAQRIANAVRKWLDAQPAIPIPMVLLCPVCGTQHIDEPTPEWPNPPHRSHLCGSCGCIWRPADVPTVGVASIATKSMCDNWEPPVACGFGKSVAFIRDCDDPTAPPEPVYYDTPSMEELERRRLAELEAKPTGPR